MIAYISESLDSKRNGGSSTSGFEFLQFLRIRHKELLVVTNDRLSLNTKDEFYGHAINSRGKVIAVKQRYPVIKGSFINFLKRVYYFFEGIGKKRTCDLSKYLDKDPENNVLYVNSWSGIYSEAIINADGYTKVCIVRGSPESFVWQSFEEDKEEAVANAAKYLEQFDRLIFVSEKGLHAWNEIFEKPIKSYYLPNSINEIEVERVKQISPAETATTLGLSKEHYNIIVVGSIQTRKAQDILQDVVKDLVAEIPNLRFHLVGVISSVWGGDEIKKGILNSAFSDYFVFHGHSNDALSFMHAGDLLLFTSRAEAFPRTVAEYMAIGNPIVASDVSGVGEMIQHKENGMLYLPDQPEVLTSGVLHMYRNPEDARQMTEKATEIYETKFSKAIHIKRAQKVFAEIEKG